MGKSYKDLRKHGSKNKSAKSFESSSYWTGKNRPFGDDDGEGFPRKGMRGNNWNDYDEDDYSYGNMGNNSTE